MKKNLSLVLALVMIVGALFSVIPMAEGESGASGEASSRYVPEIAYANVNYLDNIYMMFAVPVAELGEGESLKLLAWDSRIDSIAFSYNDIIKDVIEPETEKATIGGVEHYVFKYDSLDATQMTSVICTRPVVVKNDVAISYGKLVEYSVLEYVESAKGNLEGIEGLASTDVINSLDSMLAFGALAQYYEGGDYAFYADESVSSIYVNTIVNGVNKGRAFAGFFKYVEDRQISFYAPFLDGTTVVKITDPDGKTVEDIDEYRDGFQTMPKDSDLEFNVYYENAVVRSICGEDLGPDLEVNNYTRDVVGGYSGAVTAKGDIGFSFGTVATCNFSGAACVEDTSSLKRMNYWHSIKTVYAPDDPDNLVLQFTGTCTPAFNFAPTNPIDFSGVGFGDTIYPAFTFEITIGSVNGKLPNTGKYYFRHRLKAESVDTRSYVDLHVFTVKDGEIVLASGDVVGKIPESGMRKFAISVDALTGMTYGYAEDESGEMQATCSGPLVTDKYFNARQAQHFKNLEDDDPSNDETLIFYENIYNFFTRSLKLEPTWVFASGGSVIPEFEDASIEINGVDTPITAGVDENGKKIFNMDAVKALAERDYSFLLDDFRLVMGFAYE